jgi:FeS assembly SUF system protein
VSDAFNPFGAITPGEQPDFTATEGTPVDTAVTPVAVEDQVIAALRTVHDPEIPVNIYDLGLIYDTTIHDDGTIEIEMSLTAPGCPVAGEMPGEVARAVAALPGAGEVTVRLVWDPPWTQDLMSEDARLALGMF